MLCVSIKFCNLCLVQHPRDSRPYFTVSVLRLPFSSLSYNSQGHGGDIRPRLHTGVPPLLKVKVKVTLRLTVGQTVSLGVEPYLGLMTRYLFLFEIYGLVFCGAPSLTRGRVCLLYVYAAGPCQISLSRVRVPWYSRPYFTVSDFRLPSSSPPTTRRITVEVFDPVSTRVVPPLAAWDPRYIASGRTHRKHRFVIIPLFL
jgi:hypothetical protein